MTGPSARLNAEPVQLRLAPPLAIARLQDHGSRNRMSPAMPAALTAALRTAARNSEVKVVVIEGMPDVFCAGHTIGALLGDHQERRVAEGWEFVRAAADCPLPVVAAAQGHAIGAGLLLALYADVIVFSTHSSYALNALHYGITPCYGATHLVPAKMGAALGTEMLFTGRSYRGRELAERGAGILVVPHDAVPAKAHSVALRMAQSPRRSLQLLKNQLTVTNRVAAEAAQRRETADHMMTLAEEEVRERVRLLHAEGDHTAQ
jgi:polyketide biosynthesis enoyl-CoA hydratase PksI